MKILIIGLPLFAKRAYNDLRAFDSENTYTFLNTYYNFWDRLKAAWTIPNVDLVYSINGAVKDSSAFSLALCLNKLLVIHWVGTDVLSAKKHIENGEHNQSFIDRANHLCEVGWIQKELEESGITSEVMNFASFEGDSKAKEVKVDPFYVLTYITYERAEFYGIKTVINMANANQDIAFKIAGMDKYDAELPKNIELLGWIDNMGELIAKSGVCLRYTKHDGLSSFVLETLAHGKQIIYNNELDHCLYAADESTVEEYIHGLRDAHARGEDISNEVGKQFIRDKFNKEYVLGSLVKKFESLFGDK
jgi:hypothetical protein